MQRIVGEPNQIPSDKNTLKDSIGMQKKYNKMMSKNTECRVTTIELEYVGPHSVLGDDECVRNTYYQTTV